MTPPSRTTGRPARRRCGQALLLFAIVIGVLGAMAGLILDGGRLYFEKRRVQTMADAAALGAAHELRRGGSAHELEAAARHDAELNGLRRDKATLTLSHPPRSGPRAGEPGFVEVVVEQQTPTSFMRIVGAEVGRVAARAVAGVQSELAPCVIALDPEAAGALALEPGADLAAACAVAVASRDPEAIVVAPGACLTAHALSVGAAGFEAPDSCLSPAPGSRAFPVDPLAGLALPSPIGAPVGQATAGPLAEAPPELLELIGEAEEPAEVVYYWPGRYPDPIEVASGAAVFLPGDYFLDAGLTLTGGAVYGEDVRFFRLGGRIEAAPEAVASLRAPEGDAEKSLLFADLAGDDGRHRLIPADARAELTGTLYFPQAALEWAGNPPGLGWARVIARAIRVVSVGGPQQAANPPDAPISTATQVALAE